MSKLLKAGKPTQAPTKVPITVWLSNAITILPDGPLKNMVIRQLQLFEDVDTLSGSLKSAVGNMKHIVERVTTQCVILKVMVEDYQREQENLAKIAKQHERRQRKRKETE